MKKTLIIISVIIGILTALQVRSFKKIDSLLQRAEPGNILSELRIFQFANAALREQLEKNEERLDELNSTLAHAAVDEEIKRLRLLSGDEPVSGEGIEITFSGAVEEFWISDLIAQLLNGSAEAIALNDIRLTPINGGFRMVGTGFVFGQNFLKPPLRISVIGLRDQIKNVISQHGGIIDRIKNSHPDLSVTLSERDSVIIGANTKKAAGE